MNKYLKLFYIILLIVLLPVIKACKDNTPDQPNQQGNKITAVHLDLLAEGKGKQDVTIQFRDTDGVNGKQSASPLRLQENTTYTVKIMLLDESKTPAADVSVAYNNSFQVTGGANLTITKTDRQFQFKTGAATTNTDGLLRLEMKQNTDVQNVTFPLLISQ